MTSSAVILFVGFIIFTFLMASRILPAVLALPLMAAFVSWLGGLGFAQWLNDVALSGALRLASPFVLVIFGAIFARVIEKTGISGAIVKRAAELAGDSPTAIAFMMTAASAFVFLGMSGLGGVIMAGAIALPVMTGAGIPPIDAACLLLFGIAVANSANIASYGVIIGLFGSGAALSWYLPNILITVSAAIIYILKNIRSTEDTSDISLRIIVKNIFSGFVSIPEALISAASAIIFPKPRSLLLKNEEPSGVALFAPAMPLLIIAFLDFSTGLGASAGGLIDPSAAAVFGFAASAVFAAFVARPGRVVSILSGAISKGISDISGVLFLFIGIGMLVAAVTHPDAAEVLRPAVASALPNSREGLFVIFALLAPAALYRGPFNIYGMGAGIAVILTGLELFPARELAGIFLAVGYVQLLADPTNSHNVWIGGFTGADPALILKKILPYAWAMCLAMLAVVWGRG